jgi:hypothetical protein
MADLLDTLSKIQNDPALSKKFMTDPQGTLAGMGLDTSQLTVKKTTDLRRVRAGSAPRSTPGSAISRPTTFGTRSISASCA